MTYPTGNPRSAPPAPPQSQPPSQQAADDALQFDRAEFATAGGDSGAPAPPAVTTCSACQERLTTYYAAGEHIVCPPCRDQILASMTGGSGARRLFRATLFGVLAGIAGALVWIAVRHASDREWAIVSIAVGFAVGAAVRKGSDDRGGVAYQLLAVAITYCAIVSTYVPFIYAEGLKEQTDMPRAALMIISIIIAFIAPVLMGLENIIGMLIIAFALWEAWRINKYRKLEFTGPFTIADGGSGTPAPAAAAQSGAPPPRWSDSPPPPAAPPPPPPQLGMT